MSNTDKTFSTQSMADTYSIAKKEFDLITTLLEQAVKEIKANEAFLSECNIALSLCTPRHLAQAALELASGYADYYESAEAELENEGRTEGNNHG